MSQAVEHSDVVIVGGGAAGLAALRSLTKAGLSCLLLEAAPSLGGRIFTLRRPGWQIPIELGAEFVHGRPAPTLALGHGALSLVHVAEQRVRGGAEPAPMTEVWPRFAQALQAACQADPNSSVLDYMRKQAMNGEQAGLVRLLVEGYHAAPLDDVSARAIAADAVASREFKQYRTAAGYDAVLRSLEAEASAPAGRILLGTRVTRLAWRPGAVTVVARRPGQELQAVAKRAIVTCSIGVLKASAHQTGMAIEPLPRSFDSALPLLGMGAVLRVVMRFERAPWVAPIDGREANFVHCPKAPFETLWREGRAGQVQITAWAGGPQAAALSRLPPARRFEAALAALATASASDVATCQRRLIEAHCHDFNLDPLTRGAYSYVRPGGEEAARQLAEPCAETLFFAGEALDLEYPGTVAGAIGSGEHTARRVLATWN